MNLNQAFGNVTHACNECLLSKEQRVAVDESLQILVQELNAFDVLKKKVKEAKEEAKALPTEKSAGDEKPEKK